MIDSRFRAALVLILVFVAGVLAGVFIDRHHLVPASPRRAGSVTPDHEALLGELREELDLDEAQVRRIRAILDENQETVDRMWEQLQPGVQEAMQQVHLEIAELLRPEQTERFHEWLLAQRRRFRHATH